MELAALRVGDLYDIPSTKITDTVRLLPHMCKGEHQAALNVQSALAELNQDVSLEVAAEVWRHYSNSILAGWLTGAETPASAKEALFSYVQHAHHGGFVPEPPGPLGPF